MISYFIWIFTICFHLCSMVYTSMQRSVFMSISFYLVFWKQMYALLLIKSYFVILYIFIYVGYLLHWMRLISLWIEWDLKGGWLWLLGFNGWLLGRLEWGGSMWKECHKCCVKCGLNEVVKRREVEVWTAEMECFWSSSLEQTAIRSSKPITELLSLEPTHFFARAFLFRSSSLERPLIPRANPSQSIGRLSLHLSSLDLSWFEVVRSSELISAQANPFQRVVRLSHSFCSLDPSWLGPVRSSELISARANPSQNAVPLNEPFSSLERTVQNYWAVFKHD